jgi:FkbM family methyltransferase
MEPKYKINQFCSDFIHSMIDKQYPYITFRIDDDDAIDKNFLDHLYKYNKTDYAGNVITSINGIYLAASSKEGKLLFRRVTYPNIGIGLALVTAPGRTGTIFGLGNHYRIAKRAEVIVDDRADTWIRSLYQESDSQLGRKSIFRRHFKGQAYELLSIAECGDRLRENFPGFDLALWRDALLGSGPRPSASNPSEAVEAIAADSGKPSDISGEKEINTRYRSKSFKISAFNSDHITKQIEKLSFYELETLEYVRGIYVPNTTIFDIGANIGNHTLYFAGILGAQVVAVEPNEAALKLLRKNVTQNLLDSLVTVVAAGIGASEGWGRVIQGSERNRGSATMEMGVGSVRVVTLDALPSSDPVSLVKIDVEGMELDVLRGAGKLIDRWLPDFFIEAAEPRQFHAVAQHLFEFGYTARARVAFTPTYLFSFHDPLERFARLLRRSPGQQAANTS